MIAGWLVTALLVTLGAPFWFGLLTKVVSLRSTGAEPPPAGSDPGSATTLQSEATSAPSVLAALPAADGTAPGGEVPVDDAGPSVPDHDTPRRTIASVFGIPTSLAVTERRASLGQSAGRRRGCIGLANSQLASTM